MLLRKGFHRFTEPLKLSSFLSCCETSDVLGTLWPIYVGLVSWIWGRTEPQTGGLWGGSQKQKVLESNLCGTLRRPVRVCRRAGFCGQGVGEECCCVSSWVSGFTAELCIDWMEQWWSHSVQTAPQSSLTTATHKHRNVSPAHRMGHGRLFISRRWTSE